jgi:hypothetical protein
MLCKRDLYDCWSRRRRATYHDIVEHREHACIWRSSQLVMEFYTILSQGLDLRYPGTSVRNREAAG